MGVDAVWKQAEQIQDKVGRTLLGLSKNTPGEVPRAKLGWLSLKARRDFKQLLYWGKLVMMDGSRLVKKIYTETENLKNSFCGSVKRILIDLKLGHLWESEAVGDLKGWKSLIATMVRSRDTELWMSEVEEISKLRLFRRLKTNLTREDFLDWDLASCTIRAATAHINSVSRRAVGQKKKKK